MKQIGEEVKKNVFVVKYVCHSYDDKNIAKEPYTHMRTIRKKGQDIYLIDVPLLGHSKEYKRILKKGVSNRFKEMNEFFEDCRKRKNLPKILKE